MRSIDSQGTITEKFSLIPLVPCLDIYGDDEELAPFFKDTYKDEFSSSGWLCFPAGMEMVVQYDAWVSNIGISTGIAINYCKEYFPDSTSCVTNTTELINFEKMIEVQTKVISKYFNP